LIQIKFPPAGVGADGFTIGQVGNKAKYLPSDYNLNIGTVTKMKGARNLPVPLTLITNSIAGGGRWVGELDWLKCHRIC